MDEYEIDDTMSQEVEFVNSLSCGQSASKIKAIDRGSVHRICSGQVVLTLATAVKELVENSIDAGATIVEVKLKDSGSSVIEVIDNGAGVEETNYEGLTLKHHTSKLQDFSDLINVETFGFRGEALSSLCALSQLTITLRHKNASVGHKLEFDHHGKLVKKTPCARQVGSSVTLQNLFYTLPVRHKEFQRNLKKEFSRMVQVLNAYCVISKNVRLTCTNQQGNGKKNIVVSTNGNATMRDNISNVFGPKQLQSLLEFSQIDPSDNVCEELGLKIPEKFHILYKVTGYVSSCAHGSGRSSTDRQFYFINNRPCDPTKVSKLVNEVYHTYNRHQYPFTALNIQLDKEHIDVNVTPDKRQIFVQEEKLLLAIIKSSLIKLFEPIHSVYQVNHGLGKPEVTLTAMFSRTESNSAISTSCMDEVPTTNENVKSSIVSTLAKLKRSFTSAFFKDDDSETGTTTTSCAQSPRKQPSKQRRLDNFLNSSTNECTDFSVDSSNKYSLSTIYGCAQNAEKSSPSVESGFGSSQELNILDSQGLCDSSDPQVIYIPEIVPEFEELESPAKGDKHDSTNFINSEETGVCSSGGSQETFLADVPIVRDVNKSCKVSSSIGKNLCHSNPQKVPHSELKFGVDENRQGESLCMSVSDQDKSCVSSTTNKSADGKCDWSTQSSSGEELHLGEITPAQKICSAADPDTTGTERMERHVQSTKLTFMEYDRQECTRRKETKVKFSLDKLRKKLNSKIDSKKMEEGFYRNFRANISPTDNQSAEDELQREIKKEMFSEMEILGQFNLGFIIARLKEDLFIIDQHATDEKYNFEMLQKNTVIQSQRLIHPQSLELTASNEAILVDNLEIFRKNGFDFQIDEEGTPTQRVKLISTPMSKNWTFGKEDIEEMIFMLSESPGVSCRPTRVRQMFASRSCRKAIMIGTALDKPHMKMLVSHMGEIDQPWNCPHGRPTMRHLINLKMLKR